MMSQTSREIPQLKPKMSQQGEETGNKSIKRRDRLAGRSHANMTSHSNSHLKLPTARLSDLFSPFQGQAHRTQQQACCWPTRLRASSPLDWTVLLFGHPECALGTNRQQQPWILEAEHTLPLHCCFSSDALQQGWGVEEPGSSNAL